MYADSSLDTNRVNRLTPRQRRQVASLYGKAPKPMGTWEPLPSLTREETDVILKEYEQQTKAASTVQKHSETFSSQPRIDRDSQRGGDATSTGYYTTNYSTTNNTNAPRSLSSPSLLHRTGNYTIERTRPVTEYMHGGRGPPHSSSTQHYTQGYPYHQSPQTTQQPPSASEFRTSNNWTAPHLSVSEQQHCTQLHSQTTRVPSHTGNTAYYTQQQYGPPSANNWTTCYEASSNLLASQSHPTTQHYSTTVTQNRAPSPSSTTTLHRPPSPITSSPWTTDHGNNWSRPSEAVDNHSAQLVPLHSSSCTTTINRAPSPITSSWTTSHHTTSWTSGSVDNHSTQLHSSSSCQNYSSQGDYHTPSPTATSHSVSQLSSDLASLGITLNPSSIEDVSNVDYSILVVGVTGSGKSSACNFFIGDDVFNTAGGAIAVTAKSDAHVQTILGRQVLFIDTPGFGDEFASDEVRMAELGRAILFAREGVNAIVLCMDGSRRFDSSIAQLLKEFEVLGAFWPYTFIMYTHAADMGNTEEERRSKVSHWLGNPKCPERMKWLFDNVCYRSITVESKQFRNDTGYYRYKSQELLDMIETISTHNHHQRYTNQFFQWAKRKYDQVKWQKLAHERKLEETQRNLQSYQNTLKLMEGDLRQKEQQHAEYVSRQQQYINSLEAQLRSCREEERTHIQRQRAEAQQHLTYCAEDHQAFVDSRVASKAELSAKYDEDSKQWREHEWQSRRIPLELFLDELRYELYASNRERRELNDKLVCVNAKLQRMEEERAQQQKEKPSTFRTMAVEGAKFAAPYAIRSICSLM